MSEIVKRRNSELENSMKFEALNQITVTYFEKNNPAHAPTVNGLEKYFTTTESLKRMFRQLNNKRSTSFDGIQNLVLKILRLKLYLCTR